MSPSRRRNPRASARRSRPSRPSAPSTSRSGRGRCSGSSARTAPARRRPSACSAASSRPTAGEASVLGYDVVRDAGRDQEPDRLPVPEVQPLRRPDGRREHRVLRRDPPRPRLPAAPRGAPRVHPARAVPRPAGRAALGRACGRSWPWPAPSSTRPGSSSSTSRRPASTRSRGATSGRSSRPSSGPGSPSS